MHHAVLLFAYAAAAAAGDTVLMVTPMFHANSWGISFSGETHRPVLGLGLGLGMFIMMF
jgi:hypothetical protein